MTETHPASQKETSPEEDPFYAITDIQTKDAALAARRLATQQRERNGGGVPNPHPEKHKVLRNVLIGGSTGVALVTASAFGVNPFDKLVGEPVMNALTPDKVVSNEVVGVNQGDTLLGVVEKEAEALVLQEKIDPARVDFSSLPNLVNNASNESATMTGEHELQPGTDFSLELIDLGSSYGFGLTPVQHTEASADLDQTHADSAKIPSPNVPDQATSSAPPPLPEQPWHWQGDNPTDPK